MTLADMPRDIDYSYTRANVIDGKFIYSSSSSKEKYSTALVSYSDPQMDMLMQWSQCLNLI